MRKLNAESAKRLPVRSRQAKEGEALNAAQPRTMRGSRFGEERRYRARRAAAQSGFTLLEVLLVIAVTVILASLAIVQLAGSTRGREMDAAAERIFFDLSNARAKAMAGEDQRRWGIHFNNNGNDLYELFSTTTNYSGATIVETTFLQGEITFSDPAAMATKDILFERIDGTTAASSVTITSPSGSRTVSVTAEGTID